MIGYVSLDETKSFLKDRYDISAICDETLNRGLHLALDKIESLPIRDGGRSKEQELIFPRIDEVEIPFDIKKAQMLEAYSLATETGTESEDIQKGIASKSIGDMSISYNTTKERELLQFKNLESARILFLYVRKTYGYTS